MADAVLAQQCDADPIWTGEVTTTAGAFPRTEAAGQFIA